MKDDEVRVGKSIEDGWAMNCLTGLEYHCAKWLSTNFGSSSFKEQLQAK